MNFPSGLVVGTDNGDAGKGAWSAQSMGETSSGSWYLTFTRTPPDLIDDVDHHANTGSADRVTAGFETPTGVYRVLVSQLFIFSKFRQWSRNAMDAQHVIDKDPLRPMPTATLR